VCFLPCQGQIYKTIIVLNSMQQKKKLKRLRISNKQAESIYEKLKLNNYLGNKYQAYFISAKNL